MTVVESHGVTADVPRPRMPVEEAPVGRLHQRVSYPQAGTALLTVTGEIDAHTAPRLEEMLQSRLCTRLRRLVLDLSGLDFLGLAGVRVITTAELRAWAAGCELILASGGNREVTRVLSVTAGLHQLRWHPTAATTTLSGGEHWARA